MNKPYLAIGPGATGKTYWLQSRVENLGADPANVVWLGGRPRQPVTLDVVTAQIRPETKVIAADDLQWFDVDALAHLNDLGSHLTIVATRRPETGNEAAQLVDLTDLLATQCAPIRLGLLNIDQLAPIYAALRHSRSSQPSGGATNTDELTRIHKLVAGSVGLAADVVGGGWDGSSPTPPRPVVDAVQSRIDRAGPEAKALTDLLAALDNEAGIQAALDVALGALPPEVDADMAQRSVRAGGLVDENDRLIPLVALASRADKTENERARLHDTLASALSQTEPVLAAIQVLEGSGTLPDASRILAAGAVQVCGSDPSLGEAFIDRAESVGLDSREANLLRALTSFHAGSSEAMGYLDKSMDARTEAGTDPRTAMVGFGLDMRDLRFSSASTRPIGGELESFLTATARSLVGELVDPTFCDGSGSPLGEMSCGLGLGVSLLAVGDVSEALSLFGSGADDFDRIQPTVPLGITPHLLGALGALLVGDLVAVDMFTAQAISNQAGGPGELLGHQAVRAYGQVMGGQYTEAMDLLRSNPPTDNAGDAPNHRDRLLLAGLDAAIARRSGDTARLRSAWARAQAALLRPSASWYLIDIYADLLTAGARLGDERRVEPVLNQLIDQSNRLPNQGPGRAAGSWLGLQIGIARKDNEAVESAARALQTSAAKDQRSMARMEGASVWAQLVKAEVVEDQVVGAAKLLTQAGDPWEASRLLGQAALDCEDPKGARRMLELARVSVVDASGESAPDGLGALGLSERESEVAKLIAEGRTHKEVGAQLFISPKTVEHHVARVRQKVGATSRADLLSIIREHLG